MTELDALLDRMGPLGATDLHLKVGRAPEFRLRGVLERYEAQPPLTAERLAALTQSILTPEQSARLKAGGDLDFGYGSVARGRYRVCYYREQDGWSAAFRRLPGVIPSLAELNLPEALEDLARLPKGLVLVTGATGSGKTTTLAALIDIINGDYRKHVITLEDPVEFLHESKRSIIHQRGIGYEVPDFATGIATAMREDPDVLMIGELRDTESMRLAISAAELGILVFTTLHTNGAAASIDRIIDMFPSDEQHQVRAMLAGSLAGVVSQVLLPSKDGRGRRPATEVLFGNPAISNLIRENKIHEVSTLMQAGRARGMRTLDDSIEDLLKRGLVSPPEAVSYTSNRTRFEHFLE